MNLVTSDVFITREQDQWLDSQIASGKYGDGDEIIRDLLSERIAQQRAWTESVPDGTEGHLSK